MKLLVKKGTTSKSVDIFIRDSSATTGVGLTGLVYNSGSLVAYYHRPGSTATAITLATQTVAGAYSSGGFVEISSANMPGLYRLDLPDAVIATGVNEAVVMLKGATNMEPVVLEIQLTDFDPNDTVRLGLTALPNAAAEAAGGLFTRGTGAGQITQPSNGVVLANTNTPTPHFPVFQRKYNTLLSGATLVHIPIRKRGTGDYAVGADWTPAAGDVKVSKDGGAAADITNLPTALVMGNTALWAFILTAAELSAKKVVVTMSDSATKAVEDAGFTVETYGSSSAMYPSDWSADTVDAETRFLRAVKGNVLFTVGNSSTTTSIVTSSIDPAATATDQFKGQVVCFAMDTTTAALRGQKTDITSSSSGGVLTVNALSNAPVSGDYGTIL